MGDRSERVSGARTCAQFGEEKVCSVRETKDAWGVPWGDEFYLHGLHSEEKPGCRQSRRFEIGASNWLLLRLFLAFVGCPPFPFAFLGAEIG